VALYSMADRTSGVTAATAAAEIRTAATDRGHITELGLFMAAATASTYGFGRPAAIGITPTSPKTVLAQEVAEATGTVTTAVAWGTGPTVPANFFRRISLPAVIGTGVIWTFPRLFTIAVSSSAVIWNIGTDGVIDFYVDVDE
jgi:hypothetical protein